MDDSRECDGDSSRERDGTAPGAAGLALEMLPGSVRDSLEERMKIS
jgi:hypothetical protein